MWSIRDPRPDVPLPLHTRRTEEAAEVLLLGLGVVHALGEDLLLLRGVGAGCGGAEAVAHAPLGEVALVVAALAAAAIEAAARAAADEDDGADGHEHDGELGVDCTGGWGEGVR
jgi:hypothetical protein